MQITAPISNLEQLQTLVDCGVTECLIAGRELSRWGELYLSNMEKIFDHAEQFGINPVLVWDVLMEERKFDHCRKYFDALPAKLKQRVRVQDLGALEYIRQNYPDSKLQLVVEHGNHNLIGLKAYESYAGEQLERLILSNEIPFEKLKQFRSELRTPLEVLVMGKNLIFYGQRKLLSPLTGEEKDFIRATANSEETPHKGFSLLENKHGTFMFNTKDICLVTVSEKLQDLSIQYGRIDVWHLESPQLFAATVSQLNEPNEKNLNSFLEIYGEKSHRGFFHVNKSNVLFPKLKNSRLHGGQVNFIGHVLDVKRPDYIAVKLAPGVALPEEGECLNLIHPEGKDTQVKVKNPRFWSETQKDIILMDYLKGSVIKAALFKASS